MEVHTQQPDDKEQTMLAQQMHEFRQHLAREGVTVESDSAAPVAEQFARLQAAVLERLAQCREQVTVGRKVEEAQPGSEVNYRRLFEQMTDGFALYQLYYDAQGQVSDWAVLEVNPAYTWHTGVPPARVVGCRASELFEPYFHEYLPILSRVDATKTSLTYETYAQAVQQHLHVSVFPAGEHRLAGVVSNITERKRTEEALRASEQRYRSLFNGMTEGFALHEIICDDDGEPCDYRFLDINPAFEHLTGLRREDVVGKLKADVLPDDDPHWLKIYSTVALTGQPIHFDEYSTALNRHYEVFAYCPMPKQFAVIFTDISERKQAEALIEQQREELRGLAMQLSQIQESERYQLARELHDRIGQQLTVLSLNLNMISNQLAGDNPAMVHTLLARSLQLIETTSESVRDVMADLRPPALDDYGLVAALRQHCERLLRCTSTTFQVKESAHEIRLSADKEIALFRIAQEALMNVARHAQATRVNITLTVDAPHVSLEIADNGVGFDPLASVRLREKPGWGLLSMRERADAIGGRLTVYSQPATGTTVTIEVEN